MKKLTLALFALILFATTSMAQIPNNGFENWTNMGTYNNPDQWGTMNNLSALGSIFTAEKGTPGSPGSSYLKLTSKTTPLGVLNGIAVSGKLDTINMKPISGFAYNQRPQNFTGKWQHMIFGSSQGAMTATLTKWNPGTSSRDTVAIADRILSGMVMSWATFTTPFVYHSGEFPDSCIIFLRASGPTPTNLDYLYVDDLSFTGTVAGIEHNASSANEISIFPNPAKDKIILDLNIVSSSPTIIHLTDMNGKVVVSKNAGILYGSTQQILNISGLSAGNYLVKVIYDNKELTQKVIIQ